MLNEKNKLYDGQNNFGPREKIKNSRKTCFFTNSRTIHTLLYTYIYSMAERSLVILKPDTVHRGLVGQVTARIEQRGFKIVAMKMAKVSQAKLDEHYGHLTSKPFYPEIVAYMTMGPVVFMIVEGDNAVGGMRQLCGATDPSQADMGTIRADFATTIRFNLIHASDSVENAEAEVKRFFNEDEICAFEKKVIQ